jgi:hypothetical protein
VRGQSALKILGRIAVALIVILLCSWPFYIGFIIIGDSRWESGVPTDEVRGLAGYAYVGFWLIAQAAIVYFVDRWIRR